MSATATSRGLRVWAPEASPPLKFKKIASKSTNPSSVKNIVIDKDVVTQILDYLLQTSSGEQEFRHDTDPNNELDFRITVKPDRHPRLTIYQDGKAYKTYKLANFTNDRARKEQIEALASKLKECVEHHFNSANEVAAPVKLRISQYRALHRTREARNREAS